MKEFINRALTVIKEHDNKLNELYNLGIDLVDLYSGCETTLIEAIAKLIGKDEDVMLDWIYWWLYEDVDKIIYENGGQIDVTDISLFIDFLMNYQYE